MINVFQIISISIIFNPIHIEGFCIERNCLYGKYTIQENSCIIKYIINNYFLFIIIKYFIIINIKKKYKICTDY